MFDAAVPAVAAMWSEREGSYCCPMCGEFFTEDQIDALSIEDTPPKNRKGHRRVKVLTCQRCNNSAGTRLDLAMLEHEELRDARLGRMAQPRECTMQTSEGPVFPDIQINDGTFIILGSPKANRKEAQDAWEADMASITSGKLTLSWQFRPPLRPQPLAEIAWLRSAYLVAFAAFGYCYAFSPALEQVRAQLDPGNWDRVLIGRFGTRLRDAKKSDAAIRRVYEPEPLRSIMVQMGEALVFLPLQDNAELYTRLANGTLNLRCVEVPWPVPPPYGMGPDTCMLDSDLCSPPP